MSKHPRLLALATAIPPYDYPQQTILAYVQHQMLGPQWQDDPQVREWGRQMERLFAATRVERRQGAVDLLA